MTFGFPAGYDVEKTAANALPKAAFDDVEFAYSDVTVRGGIRHAEHEFPHSPGAEIEKMGRKPYTVTFVCTFHYVPGSELDRQYPELYPTRLRQLREKFERELTAELVVPTIGTIKAVATSWTQQKTAQEATGEHVTLEFVEDQDSSAAFDDQTTDFGPSKLFAANDDLQAAAALADFKKQQTQSLFQDINDAVTAVQGVFGQADAYSRLVEGKIQAVVNLCAFADSQAEELQHPENHLVVDALKDLWLASQQLGENVIQSRKELRSYTVPRVMSVGQISAALYGTSEKASELLQLNGFDDALAVPAGFVVRYLSD